MKSSWQRTLEEVERELDTNHELGLTDAEAERRFAHYGPNELKEGRRFSALGLFFGQFANLLVGVLAAAVVLSIFLGEWADAVVIGVIIIVNAFLGFFQEYAAERAIEALRKWVKPTAKVVRGGELKSIEARKIVPGDLVVVESGDMVPADGRIVYFAELMTQEAALTGESTPIAKTQDAFLEEDLPLGDRTNMLFWGTHVVRGRGKMIVTETATQSELGKIAELVRQTKQEKTPLEKRLIQLGHRLIVIFAITVFLVFVVGFLRGYALFDMFMTAISLAVAAIPEGLAAIVTIALAVGVKKMAKEKSLVRRLSSVETLGCTSVICTDKTGTLTQNEMAVTKLFVGGKILEVHKTLPRDADLDLVFKIALLCNDAELSHDKIIGDPTDAALLLFAKKAGLEKKQFEKNFVREIPFDSTRKRMSVILKENGGEVLFSKGAPEIILDSCALADQERTELLKQNQSFAKLGLRTLAFAYGNGSLEKNLHFVALVALIDPPRPEVKGAIEKCRAAGMRPVMITGDHKDTAFAIGKELGLLDKEGEALVGSQLDKMSDQELREKIEDISIYARVSAEHKLRIIEAWKSKGHVVAMTGDGVNDAPAIRKADIGLAMGMRGSDVTKEASDMVILDDNFATIVSAVEQGRTIYDNIMKFVSYLLAANMAEILVIFFALMFPMLSTSGSFILPLLPIQILWMNLVTDGLPAIALAVDPPDPRVMKHPPRHVKDSLLPWPLVLYLLSTSGIIAVGTLVAFYWGARINPEMGQTMALTTLIVLELAKVQSIRSLFSTPFLSNKFLVAALALSLGLHLLVLYFSPLQKFFYVIPLSWMGWGVIALITCGCFLLTLFANHFYKKRNAFSKTSP